MSNSDLNQLIEYLQNVVKSPRFKANRKKRGQVSFQLIDNIEEIEDKLEIRKMLRLSDLVKLKFTVTVQNPDGSFINDINVVTQAFNEITDLVNLFHIKRMIPSLPVYYVLVTETRTYAQDLT
jgi:hypothetical protein